MYWQTLLNLDTNRILGNAYESELEIHSANNCQTVVCKMFGQMSRSTIRMIKVKTCL